jgi:hypothetical protein
MPQRHLDVAGTRVNGTFAAIAPRIMAGQTWSQRRVARFHQFLDHHVTVWG